MPPPSDTKTPARGPGAGLDRRTLLRATLTAGGALLLRFPLRLDAALAAASTQTAPYKPNGFVRLDPDGTVTLYAPVPDMGQGTRTSLPMAVAEELDVPWSSIHLLQADLDPAAFPEGQGAGGSDSLYSGWEPARRAGATARALLVAAAAARLGVPASACATENAAVLHPASGRRIAYVELLADAARATVDPARVVPKASDRYRLVGTRVGGIDVPAIASGRPLYGLDFRLPEVTLRAAIAHAPRHGARLLAIDEAAARAVPGVRRVVAIDGLPNPTRLRRGVAVLADSTWAALRGRRALAPRWEESAAQEDDSAGLSARFHALAGESPAGHAGKVLRNAGDVETALAAATRTYDATFEAPFLAHACLEPMNCTAWLRDGRCDVWGPLQQPGGARRTVAEATGLAPEAIFVHPTRIGGGFGRRLLSDLAAEAAVLSHAAGGPVQVVWSREDDIAHDYYRPAVLHRVRAGLDASGRVVAWHHRLVGVSRNAYRLGDGPPESTETYGLFSPRPADPAAAKADNESDFAPCAIPHLRVEYTAVPTAIATGAWRAPAHCVNAFVIECALDELARLAGRDALAIRREVLGRRADYPGLPGEYDPDRAVEALERAAEAIGFGRTRERGRGIGLAGHFTFTSYAAVGVEVEVGPKGALKVVRAIVVVDCGRVINRAGVEAQAEGGVIDGLGSALFGEITVRAGATEQSNFDGYRLIRQGEAPPVEVHILEHGDARPRGMGEITLPPAAPALANAIFDACGVRLRRLPLAPALASALGRDA